MMSSVRGSIFNIAQSSKTRSFSSTSSVNRVFAHVVSRKTKAPRPIYVGLPDTVLPSKKPEYPPYPYGESCVYKQSNRGLYGGKVLQFGHKVSEKFNQKSGRIFYPNIQKTILYSDALKKRVPIRLATSVLRTITKEGGLDNYLIKDTPSRIKESGPFGWRLRFDVSSRMEEIERTSPKPIPGLTVGRARLIKDLFTIDNANQTSREFRDKLDFENADQSLEKLQSVGVDISKYKSPK